MSTVVPCLKAGLFPQYIFEAVPAQQVQQALREIFTHWGKPASLRVDNGPPWGNRQHLPSALTLWLFGLGVDVIHNRPYRPEDNSQVERTHGTVKRWVEPTDCQNLSDLESRLNQAAFLHRERYPSCDGLTRLQAYPALKHPAGSSYAPATEAQLWQFERACEHLAQYCWPRKVSKIGQISLYNRNYSVGRPYSGQMVCVHFDASTRDWMVEDVHGQLLCRRHFEHFTAEAVQTMTMTRKKKSRKKRSQS